MSRNINKEEEIEKELEIEKTIREIRDNGSTLRSIVELTSLYKYGIISAQMVKDVFKYWGLDVK